MSSTGNLIRTSDFSRGFTYHSTIDSFGSNQGSYWYYYFYSPCFVVRMYTRSWQSSYMAVWRCTPTSSSALSYTHIWDSGKSSNSKHAYFYHNCGTENLEASNAFAVKGDDSASQHLYCIGVRRDSGSSNMDLDCWSGTAYYRNAVQGELIRRTGGSNIYYTNQSWGYGNWNDREVINYFKPSNYRGTLITPSQEEFILNDSSTMKNY